MLIFNAGVPRSGTVLVNAIVQALLRAQKVPTQVANPVVAELPQLLRNLQRRGDDRYKATLIHTHEWDTKQLQMLGQSPFVTGFINFRDPRDVCVSMMTLHDLAFEEAAKIVPEYFRAMERMLADVDLMVIPYEHLVANPPAMIFQIARKLGFFPALSLVEKIHQDTSVERHRKVMEDVRDGKRDKLNRRSNRKRVLVEDSATLINDRHIQSGVTGRWRDELTPEQQADANRRFGSILTLYGYPVD